VAPTSSTCGLARGVLGALGRVGAAGIARSPQGWRPRRGHPRRSQPVVPRGRDARDRLRLRREAVGPARPGGDALRAHLAARALHRRDVVLRGRAEPSAVPRRLGRPAARVRDPRAHAAAGRGLGSSDAGPQRSGVTVVP
jgi:hypothetical protein